jgi:hypothetical protein
MPYTNLRNKLTFYVDHMALVYLVNKPQVFDRLTRRFLLFLSMTSKLFTNLVDPIYHNPNFGLVTKARACKKARQRGEPGGTSYTPGSVRQLLSLYLRFYKVTMLESTNATNEGRM